MNLYLSVSIGQKDNLTCEWYVLILLGDSFLGVFITFVYLYIVEESLKGCKKFEFKSGRYSNSNDDVDEISCTNYLYQLSWFVIISISVNTLFF
jgi:hypothetical protein